MRADFPAKITQPLSRWWRYSRAVFLTVVILAGLLMAARVAMPYALRNLINKRLNQIPDYSGSVEAVDVSLWRGAYAIRQPVIMKRSGEVKEPFFKAEKIDFSIAWRELLRGQLVSDIELTKPMLTFVEAAGSSASQAGGSAQRWQDVIDDIFPITITYFRIVDGEIRYIDQTATPKADVRVAHLATVVTGLANRRSDTEGEFPTKITASGETIGSGKLRLNGQLEPLAEQPHFLLKLELEGVSLPALNEFLRAYGGVDVSKGTFNAYVEATGRDGRFQGYFKPFFDGLDFSEPAGVTRPLGQKIWETVVRGLAWVFKNHPRDEVATKIPFSGEFKDVKVGVWQTVKNLIGHAFIQPLTKKLDSRATSEKLSTKTSAEDDTAKKRDEVLPKNGK
jgi:hypothetical protein